MKKIFSAAVMLVAAVLIGHIDVAKAAMGSATVPITITVNGAITVTDASNDTVGGKDPTLNVSITVDPDIGATAASDTATFRVRSNYSSWELNAQQTVAFDPDTTAIDEADVAVDIVKTAGADANAAACSLTAPFNATADLSDIPTGSTVQVCDGTAKTASAKSNSANADNWLQFETTYTVEQDFFFEPGTATATVTYVAVNI